MKDYRMFVVRGSEDGNIAVCSTRKNAMRKAIDYIYQATPPDNGKTVEEIFKAKYAEFKTKEYGHITIEHESEMISAEIQEFSLNY